MTVKIIFMVTVCLYCCLWWNDGGHVCN